MTTTISRAVFPVVCAMAAACGAGGTVDRYALCGATDTCPSQTTCEEPVQNATGIASICTWSCGDVVNGGSDSCPNDSTGTPGACMSPDGIGSYGFCFRTCPSGICPNGEVCMQMTPYASPDQMVAVCVPMSGL
jgi:hypothetical protein